MPVCWHTFERTWNHVCVLTVIADKYLLQRCKDGGTRSPQLIVVAGHGWSHQSNMFQQVFGTQHFREVVELWQTCHLPDNYYSVSYMATMDFLQPQKTANDFAGQVFAKSAGEKRPKGYQGIDARCFACRRVALNKIYLKLFQAFW